MSASLLSRSRRRILLVDDDEEQWTLVRHLLPAAQGYELAFAGDLTSARAALAEGDYTVVLLDYRLGAESGLALMSELHHLGVPAIMLTGDDREESGDEALQAGATDYLVKGEVTAASLRRAIRYAVERHHARAELERREALYRALAADHAHSAAIVASSQDAIQSQTLDGIVLSWNAGAEQLYGYAQSEIVGCPVTPLEPPERRGEMDMLRARAAAGEHIGNFETERLRRDGTRVTVALTVSPVLDDAGRVTSVSSIARDLSEQVRAKRELALMFELSPDILCTANIRGYFTRVNPAFTRLLGYTAEQLLQAPFLTFVHPDDQAATATELARLARGETTFAFTNRYRATDGTYRWLDWHARSDTATGVIYAVARDLTSRRQLEEQLQHIQKMDAIGQLAGGVAHDFNNVLTAMMGFADLALQTLPGDEPAADEIRQIVAAGESAMGLTRQLLAFSRRQLLQPETLDVGDVVTRVAGMLQRLLGEHVVLTVTVGPDTSAVEADRVQLEQVLVNLAVNARDAMPGGGRLSIEARNLHTEDGVLLGHVGLAPGAYVQLAVSDTGCGMSEAVRARIFEPFFTTKEYGKGTGLGLATVYGIVKQSGGIIAVESAPGSGSTFRICLPACARPARTVEQARTEVRSTTGTGTVLVVEDQHDVRSVVVQILERHGYSTIAAADLDEALHHLTYHDGPLDLVLTDVVLTGGGGTDVAEAASRHRPGVPVLYMSGYTEASALKNGVLRDGSALIEKPFTAVALLQQVRKALATPAPPAGLTLPPTPEA